VSRRVGIDVGGTKAQAVVLDDAGEVVATAQRPTPRGDHSLPALVEVLLELADAVGHDGSLGVGVPGLVSREGVLRAAPNLDGVADFPIAELLTARLGTVVHVDNDATCATVAEWLLGAEAHTTWCSSRSGPASAVGSSPTERSCAGATDSPASSVTW
jgi:predicted NBD/HSP70 family sugar kinase